MTDRRTAARDELITKAPRSPDNGWWAERTANTGAGGSNWCPTLQLSGICLSLPVWFDTEAACRDFIQNEVVGQALLDE